MKTAGALRIIRGPLEKHTLAGNTVGILFAEGSDADALIKLTADIADAGGVAKLIALKLGKVPLSDGSAVTADAQFSASPQR